MRVLVTGGTGFVGFHTVVALCEAGHEVRLLVRSLGKTRRIFGPPATSRLELVAGDITDEDSVKTALEGCDGVVHSAAMVSVHADDAERVLVTNLRGTELVLGGAHARGCERMVQVSSTTALYRPGAERVDGDSPLPEGAVGYGRSKVECDRYVRELQAEGAPIQTTYPGSVMGPDDPGLSEAMAGLKSYLDGRFVSVTSTGMQIIDVRDLALAHVRLLERGGTPGRYAMGGHYVSWEQLADLLEVVTGESFLRAPAPPAAMRLFGRVADIANRFVELPVPVSAESMEYATRWIRTDDSRIQEELGLPFRDLRETVADSVRWLADTGQLWRDYAKTDGGR